MENNKSKFSLEITIYVWKELLEILKRSKNKSSTTGKRKNEKTAAGPECTC